MERTSKAPKVGVKRPQINSRKIWDRVAFMFGNLGHSAFYGALSIYFIVFVTSGMFTGLPSSIANKLIGLITGLVVIIRLGEVVVDPILGNIVDNTKTRWGKFKPWQLIGAVVSSVLLVVLFTGIFGLAKVNWVLFAILFVVLFIILDVFYSFADVSYWGMVPAISDDSHERGIYTSYGAFLGTVGWNGLTIIVVPITTFFTYLATGKHGQGPSGWLAFAVIIAAAAILSAVLVTLGPKEKHNVIRDAAQQKTTIKDVFVGIAKNDQMLWISLAYLLYSFAYVATNGVLYYYFKFVIGKPGEFAIAGVVALIVSLFGNPIYPFLNKFIPRKVLYSIGMISMIISYLIFISAKDNMAMVIFGLILFNFSFAQLVVILSLTDSIEYGQLKNGNRNEAVTLAIRPMLDKISGAFSNGMVGAIALAAGMTGSATAADMSAHNIRIFELFAFYTPLALSVLSLLVFVFKVTITEKKHAEIVEELQVKLAKEGTDDNSDVKPNPAAEVTDVNAIETVLSPVDGEIISLKDVPNEIEGKTGFPGTGFAVKPSDGKIYAPFDGTIEFTFSTRHVLGMVSNSGLETIIHVGIGTVNMRGKGFISHYVEGQKVHAGDLLLSFDRDLIQQSGYSDDVVVFFSQPKRIISHSQISMKHVHHGDGVLNVKFEKE